MQKHITQTATILIKQVQIGPRVDGVVTFADLQLHLFFKFSIDINGVNSFYMTFEVQMNLIVIRIFVQFVAK